MFHALLKLPGWTEFGMTASWVLQGVLTVWTAAFFGELLLGLFCRKWRWCAWIPVLIGAIGLLLMLMARIYPLELPFILLFWGGYALALLCGWGASVGVQHLVQAWKRRRKK